MKDFVVNVVERNQSAQQILEKVFGLQTFRGFQKDVIECVALGRDALVLMPTGGGKSLCYQIPLLMRRGTAAVVSFLIAMMAAGRSGKGIWGIRGVPYFQVDECRSDCRARCCLCGAP